MPPEQADREYETDTMANNNVESGTDFNQNHTLISLSRQHIKKQAFCESSHLSSITFDGDSVTSLGQIFARYSTQHGQLSNLLVCLIQ